jgi:hypothetical protein
MSEHDLEKLLGGFSADSLTPEEKQALYSAALQDQELFNALASEQALKELLSDPIVRRRLLASLEQKNTSGSDGSLSWLDWLRRPAGLALAGGLTATALSLVLGVRMYQESLRQAAQSTAVEEATPLSPPTMPQSIDPDAKTNQNIAPAIDLQEKGALIGKISKPDQAASPPSKTERASDIARDGLQQRRRQDEFLREAKQPAAEQRKPAEELTSSSDRKLTESSAPPATVPDPKQLEAPAVGRATGTAAPTISARSLFYGGEPARTVTRSMAKEQAMKPQAESAPQENQPARPPEEHSQVGNRAGTEARLRPLGIRYSFVVRGTDGQDQEVDAVTASKGMQPVFLTVEANQDTYIQIWKTVGSSPSQLLWPKKETGQSSMKISAWQRQLIPLSRENRPLTLTAHLSRIPLGPITRRETAPLNRLSPNQLQESITPSGAETSPEQATYVVNQDPSIVQIAVDIFLDR